MLDKDEYEKLMKNERKRVTAAETKRKKINCGKCKHYEEDTHMCNKEWPGVNGQLSARSARADHQTRTYCGMVGRGFSPSKAFMEEMGVEVGPDGKVRAKQTQEADVTSEEPRRNKPGPKPKGVPGQGS